MFFKTVISAGPVLPIMCFTDQVWAEALLGCFVRAPRWVLCILFYLEGLVGFDEGGRWAASLLRPGVSSVAEG